MVIASGDPLGLGSAAPRLTFGEPAPQEAPNGPRLLRVDGQPAFELSFWCGTCAFLFQRREGSVETFSPPALSERLEAGLDAVDADVIATFSPLLEQARYLPLLMEITPALTRPVAGPRDYFAVEQVATWGLDGFWGLPNDPRTAYYRTFETRVADDAHLYEFVVPMVPPSWNDHERVAALRATLTTSSRPTAVAVSTLDVCAPAVAVSGRPLDGYAPDWHVHWGLTHFLLDGHHKLEAAASLRRPLRLLSLLALDASLAAPADLARLPALRAAPRLARDVRKV